jgi:uncharacterized membrane protein
MKLMTGLVEILLWFCALGCALLGGLYFAFSAFIMTALQNIGPAGITAMNSINAVILRSWFMPLFFGTTLGCAALTVAGIVGSDDPRRALMIGGGLVYVLGMFGVTMFFNVPLNNALASAGKENWPRYLRTWTRWNHVRTLASLTAAAFFIAALAER